MALQDLFGKIESFDYNQVGKPQSFEANGGIVTGKQSFERPIETPLPVQEGILGFGNIGSAQNFLENAVIDGLDVNIPGFTKEMTSTQFTFAIGEQSSFNPFYKDFQFPDPVNFFDKDGENPYVNGFTKNTSPEGIGPSTTTDFSVVNGETSTFNVSTKFGDVNYDFPGEVDFFDNSHSTGFTKNMGPEGNGPSLTTDFSPIITNVGGAAQGTSTYNNQVQYVGLSDADLPELQTATWSTTFDITSIPTNTIPTTTQLKAEAQTYAWTADGPGETSAFAVNFFDKNAENAYVTGFTLNTSPIGIGPGTTEITDTFMPSYGGYTFTNNGIQTFQDSLNIPTVNFLGSEGGDGSDFRRRVGRFVYEDVMSNASMRPSSNFLDSESNIVSDFFTSTDRTIYHKTDGENEKYSISSRSASRGFKNNFYRPKVTGDGASRTLPFELAEVAKDRFDAENRIMLPPVNADGEADGTNLGSRPYGLEFSDPANGAKELVSGYTSYVQDMSSTDGKHPFIVRRMGNDWGTDDFGDGFFGNLAGGFMRTPGSPSNNFMGRLDREATDLKRKIKFISTSEGAAFIVKQFLLQTQNRTMESRFYNPLSLASVQGLVGIERNFLFGTTYEGILGGTAPQPQQPKTGANSNKIKGDDKKQPKKFGGVVDLVKGVVGNGPIQQYIDKYLGRNEDIDGESPNPQSRIKWQAAYGEWGPGLQSGTADMTNATADATNKGNASQGSKPPTDKSDNDKERSFSQKASDLAKGALKKLRGRLPGAKELKFSMHNPNQYYKIDPLSIYGKGGADGAKSLMDRLISASDRHTTVTFAEKKNSLKQKEEQYKYHYNLYGSIPTGEKSKEREYETKNVTDVEVPDSEDNPPKSIKEKKAGRYPQGILATNYTKQIQNWKVPRDPANSAPLMDGGRYDSSLTPDFVDFKFRVKNYGNYESAKDEKGNTTTNNSTHKILIFSAIINSLSDAVSPEYNEVRYLGRPDKYYTYNGVDRDISLSFTLYPKTINEFPFLAEKLNYLVGLTYPQYSSTNAMLAPYVDLTLGDMFNNQPGYISSLNVNVQENTTWEIDAFQFPKHITCDLTFRLIGRHVPHQFGKHYDLPWMKLDASAKNYGSTLFANDFSDTSQLKYGPTNRKEGSGVNSTWTNKEVEELNNLAAGYMKPLAGGEKPSNETTPPEANT